AVLGRSQKPIEHSFISIRPPVMQVSPGFFRWWRQPRKIKVGTAQEHHSIGRLCKAQILLFQLLQQEGIDRILHKLTLEDYRNVRSLGRIKGPELTIFFA